MKRIKNKRLVSVKERITEAFIELLKEKELGEITVVDITAKAQSGRISFYRNFKDKDDVLRFYIKKVTDDWLESSGHNYLTLTKKGVAPYVTWLLEHMYEHREFADILIKNDRLYLLEEEFDRRLFVRLSEVSNKWEIVYKIGGVYKLFVYWAKSGYKQSPEEIGQCLENL